MAQQSRQTSDKTAMEGIHRGIQEKSLLPKAPIVLEAQGNPIHTSSNPSTCLRFLDHTLAGGRRHHWIGEILVGENTGSAESLGRRNHWVNDIIGLRSTHEAPI